jgi:sec-independent protein translocase protein TatB
MFDFAWSEIMVIGVVALIAIGPKDLPAAMKAVTGVIKKARRMAGEFQTHVDEMVREADLQDVRTQLSEIRNFDFKGTVERSVDPDGGLRSTFATNPMVPDPPKTAPVQPAAQEPAVLVTPAPTHEWRPPGADRPADAPVAEMTGSLADLDQGPVIVQPTTRAAWDVPAFIPPQIANPPPRPAFIPPGIHVDAIAVRAQGGAARA